MIPPGLHWLVVTLHVVAAMVWVGGTIFLAAVAVPVVRGLEPAIRTEITAGLGQRFRTVGWAALAVLIVTGLLQLIVRQVGWEDFVTGQLWSSSFGRALYVKLALVAVVLVISGLHDWVLGPRATAIARDAWAGGSADAAAILAARRRATWMARINLLLTLAIVATAVALVRGLL